jgi:hypothetical protein
MSDAMAARDGEELGKAREQGGGEVDRAAGEAPGREAGARASTAQKRVVKATAADDGVLDGANSLLWLVEVRACVCARCVCAVTR